MCMWAPVTHATLSMRGESETNISSATRRAPRELTDMQLHDRARCAGKLYPQI